MSQRGRIFFLKRLYVQKVLKKKKGAIALPDDQHQSPMWKATSHLDPTPVRPRLQFYKTNAEVELTPSLSIRLKTSSTWYSNSES